MKTIDMIGMPGYEVCHDSIRSMTVQDADPVQMFVLERRARKLWLWTTWKQMLAEQEYFDYRQ